MQGINHAPYKLAAVAPGEAYYSLLQVGSEWGPTAGKVEAATGMLSYMTGWSIKRGFPVLKALGFYVIELPRDHYIDPVWKAKHTAPRTRAPYGSLTKRQGPPVA